MTENPADLRRRSVFGLNALNFFVADMLTGFGPFVAVYLTANGWTSSSVGFALTLGTVAAVVGQVPAGILVDAVSQRRLVTAIGIAAIIASALGFATFTSRPFIYGAELLIGVAASLLTPCIAAITLTLSKREQLAERLGGNVRFKALGSMLTALLMGYVGSRIAATGVFYIAASFGVAALGCLMLISGVDIRTAHHRTRHPTALHKAHRTAPLRRRRELWRDPVLLLFGGCACLFQLSNAAVLPFALLSVEADGYRNTTFLVSLAIVVSQAVAAVGSPWLGRRAQAHGRRLILLAGFGALTLRCILFAMYSGPAAIVAYQLLDGVSAAAFGVMVPLVVADITHQGGRFNLAMGLIGLAMMGGASLSTLAAGLVTAHLGIHATFVMLAVFAGAGFALILFVLPETGHSPASLELEHARNAA